MKQTQPLRKFMESNPDTNFQPPGLRIPEAGTLPDGHVSPYAATPHHLVGNGLPHPPLAGTTLFAGLCAPYPCRSPRTGHPQP